MNDRFAPLGDDEAAQKTPPGAESKQSFDYHDETGRLLYQVRRIDLNGFKDGKRNKKFIQRRPNGNGGWISDLDRVRRLPYRLPELIEAAGKGNLIVIAEGERKVDLLWSWNIPATCNSGGYGSSKIWAEHAAYFHDANVIILPDNDETGRKHANTVAASLRKADARVRILDLPGLPPKGDVIDWAAAGGTPEQLHALIENSARPWAPTECESVNAGPAADRGAGTKAAETFLIKASEIAPEPIAWLWKYWLARGKLHIIAGAPGGGKTTIYLSFAAIISSGATWPDGTCAKAGNVLIWTSEDGCADTIIPRLMRMDADLDRIFIVRSHRNANGKTRTAKGKDSVKGKGKRKR